jgi:hypothetical protein
VSVASPIGLAAQDDEHAAFAAELAQVRDSNLRSLNRAWSILFNPASLFSLVLLGLLYGRRTGQAQADALDAAAGYLSRLSGTTIPPALDAVGTMANGRSLAGLDRAAAGIYLHRVGQGYEPEAAGGATRAFLNRIAGTEPGRVANEFVEERVATGEGFSGRFRLVPSPGACEQCQQAPPDTRPPVHPFCACAVRPEMAWEREAADGWRRDIAGHLQAMEGASFPGSSGWYNDLRKVGDTLDEEIRRRLDLGTRGYDDLFSHEKDAYHRRAFEVLHELRGLGGNLAMVEAASDPGAIERLARGARYYPSAWLEASREFGPLVVGEGVDRGFYSGRIPGTWRPAEIQLSGGRSVVVHELFHRMENVVPEIRAAELRFWMNRRAGEEIRALNEFTPGRYDPSEMGIKDDFSSAYQGKVYGNPAPGNYWEIGSTAMERLTNMPDSLMILDADYVRFMLSVLGAL